MKRLLFLAFMACASTSFAQTFPVVTVKDSISTNTTWNPGSQYLLKGYVYVTAGATLTIEPGTIIRGDKNTKATLIIERGAKIMAVGTAEKPIIFTSNQPQGSRSYGDWGGVIICGKAPVNWTAGEAKVEGDPRSFYGGSDAADNSGKLSYARIEFGGIAYAPNQEVNSLTLCGVGNATQIDHIQVSYAGDDAVEFFGGNVNTKYMVAHRTWDDDFDSDNGYSGMNQFFVVLRDPYAADVSGSKAIETDSYLAGTIDGKTDNTKATKAVFSNGTLIGPLVNAAVAAHDPQFVAGVHIRRGSSLSLLNSIIAGWPCGVLLDESSSSYGSTTKNIGSGSMEFKSNIIAGISTNSVPAGAPNKNIVYVKDGARNITPTNTSADSATTGNTDFTPVTGPQSWLTMDGSLNLQYASFQNGVQLKSPFDLTNPNFMPNSGSPVVFNNGQNYLGQARPGIPVFDPTKPINIDTTSAYANYNAPRAVPNFTSTKVTDPFFTKVNYVGAFANTGNSSDNWMANWTNFDPNNTFYDYVVSVNDVKSNIETATVYPNPAANVATLKVSLTEASSLNVTLVDVTGKIVKHVYSADKVTGTQMIDINLDNLNTGLYFVSIAAGNAQKSVKLSVIK